MRSALNKAIPAPELVPQVSATAKELARVIRSKLVYAVGKQPHEADDRDWFVATALAVRDRLVDHWGDRTVAGTPNRKHVHYFSLEFLIGSLLFEALGNLELIEETRDALAGFGVDLERLRAIEPDAALGNGGLGRLAACFMESMATLDIPAYGYGIRYDYGLFRQILIDGWQREVPDNWLVGGNPWEFERHEIIFPVHFGGRVSRSVGPGGIVHELWEPAETVLAAAYDTPLIGWRGRRVNTLRLWSARAPDPLQLETFQLGDYVGALAGRARAEAISRVLYPSDETPAGQELRLRQEYFFVSASLQDLLKRHLASGASLASLPDCAAIQLNDTHPAIAVAELMRLLVDEHRLAWDEAFEITRGTLAYTNHTLLPEALESWPVELLERLLPRHMQLIYAINAQHLDRAAAAGKHDLSAISIIDEHHGRRVRMGHLAFVGSHRINGVSALHSDLMRRTVFRDLDAALPGRIVNKTNGISFRRWLHHANPALTVLLVEQLGEEVLDDPRFLVRLEAVAGDRHFQERFAAVRQRNKDRLARLVSQRMPLDLPPGTLLDVQIKRIHEYKRQTLNLLETIALYLAMRELPDADWVPRVKILSGKAAPGYRQAKLLIKLANDVARRIEDDPRIKGRLRLLFLPNYSVSLAEAIIPAADLSEQISTAGLEASGTGNMKLALNGALTIGTLDGANIEISQHVGAENMFIFGLTAEEARARKAMPGHAAAAIAASPRLAGVIDAINAGEFSPDDRHRFRALTDELAGEDRFLVCSDFDAYWRAQREADALWRDPERWWRTAILNTARMSWFSADRTIREYDADIWSIGS